MYHIRFALPLLLIVISSCSNVELAHLLSQYHEQQRADRSDYIKINEENYKKEKAVNFITKIGEYSKTYDYGSIMHYTPTSFSANTRHTIDPHRVELDEFRVEHIDDFKNIGQRIRLSSIDIEGHNAAYSQCTGEPDVEHPIGRPVWSAQPWRPWTFTKVQDLCMNQRTRFIACISGENKFNQGGCLSDSECIGSEKPVDVEHYLFIQEKRGDTKVWSFDDGGGMNDFRQTKATDGDAPMFDWALGKSFEVTEIGPDSDHTTGSGFFIYAEMSSSNTWPRKKGERGSIETVMIHEASLTGNTCELS